MDLLKLFRDAEAAFINHGPGRHFPVLASDVLDGRWPFRSWAAAYAFKYPEEAGDFLAHAESAAEAYFLRELCTAEPCVYSGQTARVRDWLVTVQKRCGTQRIDVAIETPRLRLAVEIDGLAFHHMRPEQVQADALRQRRLVLAGYSVIRFTAPETFRCPSECWRQTAAILEARG